MKRQGPIVASLAALFGAASLALAQGVVSVPLAPDPAAVKWVPLGGVAGQVAPVATPDGGKAMKVTFRKSGEERRMVALESRPKGDLTGVRALAFRYRLNLTKGTPARAALVAYEKDGGAWFAVGSAPLDASETEAWLPVTAMRQTGAGADKSGKLEWDQVERVWLGLTFDGAAEGSIEVAQARLTSEPFRASKPLVLNVAVAKAWSVGKDPAATATVTTPNEGQQGAPCMRFDFQFPGKRHMYALPTLAADTSLEGYRTLRFTYKATLPAGVTGLLVALQERNGGQYVLGTAPGPSADWKSVVVPLDQFKLAGWSKDPNNKLDLDMVGGVTLGTHGTASGSGGPGTLWISDVRFEP